jgi:hypothetical protein
MERDPANAVPRVVADAALKADPGDPEWLRNAAYLIARIIGFILWLAGTS